jgi:16S rRNA (guanine527-N7)-methyltransferase
MTDDPRQEGHPAPTDDPDLVEALARAQRLGYLGSAPVPTHLRHSQAFLAAVRPSDRVVDLGSGGGVPGLVIAAARSAAAVRLVEASEGRADHLRRAVLAMDLEPRVTVDQRPAELVGRDASLRASFDVVTARGFGPPAVVAECAAPLLRVGGRLVVSEPPGSDGSRWTGLTATDLPFGPPAVWTSVQATLVAIELTGPCPDRYPRAVGVPARRPLF